MNEIERLNPGLVVRATTRPAAPVRRAVALTGKTRKAVLVELQRRQRRGEVESAGQLQFVTAGTMAGQYAVRVTLLPVAPAPKWPRALVGVGAVLVGVAAVVGAFAWLITAMSAASVVGVTLVLLAGLGVLALSGRKPRGGNVTVISAVNVGR